MCTWKRYLVGIDGSEPAKVALRCALEMAGRFGGAVTGLNVVDQERITQSMVTPGMPYAPIDIKPLEYYSNLQDKLVKSGKQALEDAGKIANEAGVKWATQQTMGLPGTILARAAKSHDCLFIGERGLSEPGKKGLGKEVLNVARHCPRPVLVAEKFHTFSKVLIGYDGSPEAAKALRVAIDLGGKGGYEFHLVTVSEPQRTGETTIEEARAYFGAHGVDAKYHLVEGEPSEMIIAKAKEFACGLVMMGAFGHRTLHELVFGSTAQHILVDCELPVLLAK
jgi:nucleotide-binding universal stress UspA family protein